MRQTSQRQDNTDLIAEAKSVSILDIIAARVKLKRNGREYIGNCPFHSDSSPSFYVVPSKRFYHCFGCQAHGSAIDFMMAFDQVDFIEACRRITGNIITPQVAPPVMTKVEIEKEKAAKQSAAVSLWNAGVGAAGTLVERYLRSRGITTPLPNSLRYHAGVWHAEARTYGPCMLAAVQGANGNIIAVHRTWLKPDGSGKADFTPAKKGMGPWSGGHIRLAKRSPVLGIAEGIETALSVMVAIPALPCWSAMSLGNLGAPVPDEVSEVIICADNDGADKDKALHEGILARCASALKDKGKKVRIAYPPRGYDFNDWLQQLQREVTHG